MPAEDITPIVENGSKKTYFLRGIKFGLLSTIVLVIGWFGFILVASLLSIKQSTPIPSGGFIWHPEQGAQVLQGDTVVFSGGYTNRGVSRVDVMTWTSNIDGLLGNGGVYDLEFAYLSPGTHLITLVVQHGSEKIVAHESLVVRPNPILTSKGRREFLERCQKTKALADCLAEVVVFLAVWDRKQAMEVINQHREFNFLKNSYEWSIEKFTSARPHNVELCTEISNAEFRSKCNSSATK